MQKQEQLFLGPAWLPPAPRRPVSTSGKHPIKYQRVMTFHWRLASGKKKSILCPVVSYHLCRWALTDVLPTPFISCGSASEVAERKSKKVCPSPHKQPLTRSGGCVGSEWHMCVVSSSADGGSSEGHGVGRVHDPQPPARLKARGNLM